MQPYDENLEVEKVIEEDGYEYWYNPKGKWDWYTIGGRWPNRLLLKDGHRVSTALLKDIDTGLDMEEYNRYLKLWEDIMSGNENYLENPEWLIHHYFSKEIYASLLSSFWFRTVIDIDRNWHELSFDSSLIEEIDWAQKFYWKCVANAKHKDPIRLTVVDIHY